MAKNTEKEYWQSVWDKFRDALIFRCNCATYFPRTNAGFFEKKTQFFLGKLAYFNKKNKGNTIYDVDVEYCSLLCD